MSIYKNGKLVAGGSQALPLLCFMWSDHQLNHPSWLNSTTFSWQSGSVYQAAYQHLASDIDGKTLQSEIIAGTTIQFYLADDGHKICPASQESNVTAIYNATGVAWYYILDTTNQRFKLPRINPSAAQQRYGNIPVIGTNTKMMLKASTSNNQFHFYKDSSSTIVQLYDDTAGAPSGINIPAINITGDPTKSNVAADTSSQSTIYAGKKYLYFYVGNFTQAALENTAGVTTEVLNTKVTIGHEVIEFQAPNAGNSYTWYRKYADGWVEQGGYFTGTANYTAKVITLPVEMANRNYSGYGISCCASATDSGSATSNRTTFIRTSTTQITLSQTNTWITTWRVEGMAA